MKDYAITVDVYASWGDQPPRYRLYVDSDLLTERDFIWNSTNVFIRENIVVNLEPGLHTLKVEQINNAGSIRTENITVDGVASSNEFTIAG
jgi:hypothetical protein